MLLPQVCRDGRGAVEVPSMEEVSGQDGRTESAGQGRHVGRNGGPGGEQQVAGEAAAGWTDQAKTGADGTTAPGVGGGVG